MRRYEPPGVSPETQNKHQQLAGLLNMHATVCKGREGQYWYFDLNAGDGSGSPCIAYEVLANIVGMQWKMVLTEHNPETAVSLVRYCAQHFGQHLDRIAINNLDNRIVTEYYGPGMQKSKHWGVVFYDPNGVLDMSVGTLRPFMGTTIDIFIYYSATAHKRHSTQCTRIEDILHSNIKKHWLVRRPHGPWQWTFIVGTNWYRFPIWKNGGFVSWRSSEGRAIIERLQHTAKELHAKYQAAMSLDEVV
jgi:hypothetical protein